MLGRSLNSLQFELVLSLMGEIGQEHSFVEQHYFEQGWLMGCEYMEKKKTGGR